MTFLSQAFLFWLEVSILESLYGIELKSNWKVIVCALAVVRYCSWGHGRLSWHVHS